MKSPATEPVPGSTENGASVSVEPEETRSDAPFEPTEEQAAQIKKFVAILTNEKSEREEFLVAVEEIRTLGAPASAAVLGLVQEDQTGKRLYPYAISLFTSFGQAGFDFLLWAQTADDDDERQASHRILRGITLAEIAFVGSANSKQRQETIDLWNTVLKNYPVRTP